MAWFTLETLGGAIGKSKVGGSTARTVARICRADLIVIDDIGLLSPSPPCTSASSSPPSAVRARSSQA